MEQTSSTSRRPTTQTESATPSDLRAQLESLFDIVWRCERQWRIDDRFDLLLGNGR